MTRWRPGGESVEVWGAKTDNAPDGFVWQGLQHCILEVTNRWCVHTLWWSPNETIWRNYFKAATDTGFLCLIYHDLRAGGWFLARLYD